MGLKSSYQLRWKRRKLLWRGWRARRDLQPVSMRQQGRRKGAVYAFVTLRNEKLRLPYFLEYYRNMGVGHFFIVDNASSDGSVEFLKNQADVSLWHCGESYKEGRFGMDWISHLLRKFGHDHWCLTVDPDEFLVYPFCDTRPISALTDWLDSCGLRNFSAMLLDLYPKGNIADQPYSEGQNPLDIAHWFDSGNYTISRNPEMGNLWIQGGPRARVFFAEDPWRAPALNKIPLVKWHRSYCYVSSTHMILPRGLNLTYEQWGGEKVSGVLLHTKFLNTLQAKAAEELARGQHYSDSTEYRAYHEVLAEHPDLWTRWSERYVNWRQLEIFGLMSKGNWA